VARKWSVLRPLKVERTLRDWRFVIGFAKQDVVSFKYILAEPPRKPANGTKNNDKDGEKAGKTKVDEMSEAVRDLKISWIPKLG
jgi:hypothetical protein